MRGDARIKGSRSCEEGGMEAGRYTYRIRKDGYAWNTWHAEKLDWGIVVRRYDFGSEDEARSALERWKLEDARR